MSAAHDLRLTPEEYLAIEREAERKSEYYDGRMYLMAGTSRAHSLIVMNVTRVLGTELLDGPCEVYASDMRLKVTESGLYTYPDVMVACPEIRFDDRRSDTLLNPKVIIEVLSPSTEAYDRGQKFALYQALSSLREYVLISQVEPRVERFTRQPGSTDWVYSEATGLEREVELSSIGCRLRLSAAYHKVDLTQRAMLPDDRVRESDAPAYAEPRSFPGSPS